MAKAPTESGEKNTRASVMRLLKTEGPMTSAQLADHLGVTAMAVRQHLYDMQEEKLVTVEERPVPIGRPAKYWQLTSEANRFFPDSYADLNVSLLGALGEAFGSDGVERVLEIRLTRQLAAYRAQIAPSATLKQRLQQLARIRSEEGYMAELKTEGKGRYLFLENHCPIRAAAMECKSLCAVELNLFRKLLGANVEVRREEHIIAGERRCAYRVQEHAVKK